MTSYFHLYQGLSEETRDAYRRYNSSPRNSNERLRFYLIYLNDVVPNSVTTHHVRPPPHLARPHHREAIQLLTPTGYVFMTGLISPENTPNGIENMAADEAYDRWVRGHFAHRNYHFFTGLLRLRFCEGFDDGDWDRVQDLHPVHHARQIANYLQNEFERAMFSG